MAKHKLDLKGVKNLIFPYLPVLVGVNVDGKPNYITIGLIGWLCYDTLAISVGHQQYSRRGLEENRTFSVNQVGAKQVRELDFCGTASGRTVDKAALFATFYGETETAPMIDECPINVECRVIQTLIRPVHTVFLGEVVAVHARDDCLANGIPDVTRMEPIFYAPDPSQGKPVYSYWALGERLGRAYEVGNGLQPK
ncbi:MAG: flavin reductase family protein [Candidatus Bipolaricaulis sp.]|nr:flavin reductase family protein [Candidatus Bipolaricaulis sp.]